MPGVCGTSLVLPGRLVLDVMGGMGDVERMQIRHYNVVSWADPHTSDLTKHHDCLGTGPQIQKQALQYKQVN